MKIKPIDDNNSNFELVILKSTNQKIQLTPYCKIHGAMNKVSVFKENNGGYWRCNTAEGIICRAGCIQF